LKNDIYFWYNDGQSNYIGKTSRTSTSYSWSIPSNLQGSVNISVVSGREENNRVYTDTRDEVTIKVTCGGGGDGDTDPKKLPAPIHSEPPNGSSQTPPVTFEWNDVSGAEYYGLYIRDMETNTLIYDSEEHERGGKIYGHSHTPDVQYVAGREYRWNMRAGANDIWSNNFSARWVFTIQSSGGGEGNPSISITSPSSGSSLLEK